MSPWDKIDSALSWIYLDFQYEQEHGEPPEPRYHEYIPVGGKINVFLQYSGELSEIQALGFEVTSEPIPNAASGDIVLENLEKIVAHPGVVRMSYGFPSSSTLDVSVFDINVSEGKVWTRSGDVFSGNTGANTIVGIMDTGIDFRSPSFHDPAGHTRILCIWDMGLLHGETGQDPPDPKLLADPTKTRTYGVEYKKETIDQALQGMTDVVRHHDFNGHGTFLAQVAAGNGGGGPYVGVAPEALLMIVKVGSLQAEPPANYTQRFFDAVFYLINKANQLKMPLVINYSRGSDTTDHGGISVEEEWLSRQFAQSKGMAFVAAAGNSAGTMLDLDDNVIQKNQHARIEFPQGGGTVDVPIELLDTRTNRIGYDRGRKEDTTKEVSIRMYYPPGGNIAVSVRRPDTDVFVPGATFGDIIGHGLTSHPFVMQHQEWGGVRFLPSQSIITLNTFRFSQWPSKDKNHLEGIYTLRIVAPNQMTLHLYCEQVKTGGTFQAFRVSDKNPLPAFVHVEDRFLIGWPGGANNILTVTAYDPDSPWRSVAEFSSRGPLATYVPSVVPAKKPDIAAPGVGIDARVSRDSQEWHLLKRTAQHNGTSTSAPHVAGAVALLLSKNPKLTSDQIIQVLKGNVRTEPPFPTEEEAVGMGLLDVKKALDFIP